MLKFVTRNGRWTLIGSLLVLFSLADSLELSEQWNLTGTGLDTSSVRQSTASSVSQGSTSELAANDERQRPPSTVGSLGVTTVGNMPKPGEEKKKLEALTKTASTAALAPAAGKSLNTALASAADDVSSDTTDASKASRVYAADLVVPKHEASSLTLKQAATQGGNVMSVGKLFDYYPLVIAWVCVTIVFLGALLVVGAVKFRRHKTKMQRSIAMVSQAATDDEQGKLYLSESHV